MRKGMIIGSLAALALTGPAIAADGFSYSYVELAWVNSELSDLDIDGDGFGLKGSFEFTPALHAFAQLSDTDYDTGFGASVSGENMELGVGYAWSMSPRMDIVGKFSFVQQEIDIDVPGFGGSFEDDGFALGGYVRGKPIEQLELTGGLDFVDMDLGGSDEYFTLCARYFFTKMFAAGLDLRLNSDDTTYMLGGRFNFGK
jgi:hypothetical protein